MLEDGRIHASWSDEVRKVPTELIYEGELLVPGFVRIPWNDQDVRLVLSRDEGGEVSGLTLTCDMVRGVTFERRAEGLVPARSGDGS